MEIWLDTDDFKMLEKAKRMGLLYGMVSPRETLEAALSFHSGPIAVQIAGMSAEEMILQGRKLRGVSSKIIANIPVTKEGLEAIHELSKEGLVMGGMIYHPNQALLAAIAGAAYVSPYFSRMQKLGENPLIQIESMMQMMRKYDFKTKIIAASLKTAEQIRSCAELGFHGVLLKDDLFTDFTDTHELTALAVEQFLGVLR